ncbi:hypothetical protein PUN28_014690 [Cardiocondyla obscurior]|uniref:Uncharacterized protein n=1 Tax=Cardiocondyla obscurior TaxID=286306 RepID=A0AAW2EX68_9HYME
MKTEKLSARYIGLVDRFFPIFLPGNCSLLRSTECTFYLGAFINYAGRLTISDFLFSDVVFKNSPIKSREPSRAQLFRAITFA